MVDFYGVSREDIVREDILSARGKTKQKDVCQRSPVKQTLCCILDIFNDNNDNCHEPDIARGLLAALD